MIIRVPQLTFLFLSLTLYCQVITSPADKFFDFLNNYQIDSLRNLITEDFQIKRTYTTYSNDRLSFLEQYIPDSKALNGGYTVLKVTDDIEQKQFFVLDQSDYLKCLKVDYPIWKMIITTEHDKVKQVTIDTTDMYQEYVTQVKVADEKFADWLKVKYPRDNKERLYTHCGLLIKRLEEYSE